MIDVKIIHIHHSSFITELNHAIPLSDYFKGNIPETDREKSLLMFTSHRHGDHFFRSMLDLEENRGNVIYVLSGDIQARQMPEDLLGGTVLLGPREEVSLKDRAGSLVNIQAFRPTDEGVTFLVSLEHKTIYHTGDLNNQVREGKSETDNRRMSESFYQEMGKLAGRHINVASMPIGPKQEKNFYLGMDDFMRMAGADVVFPIHFWEDFQVAARFKALACAGEYRGRIQEVHGQGEESLV